MLTTAGMRQGRSGRRGGGAAGERGGAGRAEPDGVRRVGGAGPRHPPRTRPVWADERPKPRPRKPGQPTAGTRTPQTRTEAPKDVLRPPTKREVRAAASDTLATGVQTLTVGPDEEGMRVDRFLVARFPRLAFTHVQRIVRKGELRHAGQAVRVPPLKLDAPKIAARSAAREGDDRAFLRSITLYEDADVLVLDKPFGLAVQGGSATKRHVDGLLEALRDEAGQKPRLVHRLDKDTAGCLVVAKTRFAAMTLAKTFRSRSARKIYWAVVAGVPRVRQGRVSTYLAKEEGGEGDARMRVARHGEEGASHALTYYAVVEATAQKLAWLSLKPVTGRTHQLRAHTAHIGHPIVGDPKYFDVENWQLPGGLQNRLHLLARRIVVPHPRTGEPIDVTAPLPPHMEQSWNLLGFDASRYDPIVEAPEE